MLNSRKNHFELFDLPVGFALDAGMLTERYRALVRLVRAESLNEDGGDEEGTVRSLARIDEAYRTLTDPLARAEYLFRLYDDRGEVAAEAAAAGGSFVEAMERRETLVTATNRPDPRAALSEVLTQLAEQGAALDKELHQLFADPSPSNLSAAREVVRQLQLLGRCLREAEDRQAELSDPFEPRPA